MKEEWRGTKEQWKMREVGLKEEQGMNKRGTRKAQKKSEERANEKRKGKKGTNKWINVISGGSKITFFPERFLEVKEMVFFKFVYVLTTRILRLYFEILSVWQL